LILKFQMLVSMDIHWLIFLDSQFFPVFVFAPNSNILSPSDLSNWQKTKDYPPQMVLNFLILQRLLLLLLTLPCLWSFYFDKSWYLARDVTIKFFLPELFFCGGGWDIYQLYTTNPVLMWNDCYPCCMACLRLNPL
jgi:hypothetical protein